MRDPGEDLVGREFGQASSRWCRLLARWSTRAMRSRMSFEMLFCLKKGGVTSGILVLIYMCSSGNTGRR